MFVPLICYLERQKADGGAVDTSVTGRAIKAEAPRSSSSSSIHFPSALGSTTCSRSTLSFRPPTACRRRTHRWDFMDTPCVITHRQRGSLRILPASARPPRSLHLESPSPSTLCWPRRRTRAAAGAALLSAQSSTTQQRRWRRSLATAAYQRRTSAHRPCCTRPLTCNLDIPSTAAPPSATSRHVEAHYTHKVTPQSEPLSLRNGKNLLWTEHVTVCLCRVSVQGQHRDAFFQEQRRKVETGAHQLHH